jgi:tryptophan synthase alpha chain
MNRIDKKFEVLKAANKKAFIGFITAGDPHLDKTAAFIYALEAAGTDVIEIGIPFSDPLADGPVIQEAAVRALDNWDFNVAKVMKLMKEVRTHTEVPIAYLVYVNTIIVYGKEKFISECVEAGIDGLIIPDMPLEERGELEALINATDIALIPLVAPTSKDRIEAIVSGCKGFTYCVSSLGVTGRSSDFYNGVELYLQDVRSRSVLPTAVGFGISTPADIIALKDYVDGVIVGSAIVNQVAESNGNPEIVGAFVKTLVDALR